jgi:hypothetical protein
MAIGLHGRAAAAVVQGGERRHGGQGARMLTPFEELEYLAEFIPDEGESVMISRQGGELHCEPVGDDDFRSGVEDVELYGRLVQANERLNAQGSVPLWTTAFALVAVAILIYRIVGLGWSEWYLFPALGLAALFGCFHWIRARQRRLFDLTIRPMLQREAMARHVTLYALMAGVRQHAEFRTLLDELVRWEPVRAAEGTRPR